VRCYGGEGLGGVGFGGGEEGHCWWWGLGGLRGGGKENWVLFLGDCFLVCSSNSSRYNNVIFPGASLQFLNPTLNPDHPPYTAPSIPPSPSPPLATTFLLLLHSCTPRSTSALVTPSTTNQKQTPSCSTLRFLPSSSKNSISSYAIPVALCSFAKCCLLSPGKICRWSKTS